MLRSIESSSTEFALEEEKGKKLSIFPGERKSYEWKRGSLGRLKKERASEEETLAGKHTKENESKCCRWFDAAPYRDNHLTTHTRRERKRVCVCGARLVFECI